MDLSCGVTLEPSEDVELGLGSAGAFGDVGLGAGAAEQPVDRVGSGAGQRWLVDHRCGRAGTGWSAQRKQVSVRCR